MNNLAKDFYKQGYSCSESILKAAAQKGYLPEELVKLSTAFSGGMSSGCLCGALAGSQLVISSNFGRNEAHEDSSECRAKAKEFMDGFKNKHKFSCCKALSGKYDFNSAERKANCAILVGDAAEILEQVICPKN
jgi:C_GCAxxG_C_C family probable redox protein